MLLLYRLESLKAHITYHLFTSGCVALPQTYQWHHLCARPVVCCWAYLLLLFGPALVLQPDPIDCGRLLLTFALINHKVVLHIGHRQTYST